MSDEPARVKEESKSVKLADIQHVAILSENWYFKRRSDAEKRRETNPRGFHVRISGHGGGLDADNTMQ